MPRTAKPPTTRAATRMVSSSTPARLTAYEGELRFFVETAHALASNREPKTVLRLILDNVKAMIRCEAWSLFVIDPITQDLVFDIVGGPKARRLKGLRIKPGQGIAGWSAQHGKGVMVADTRKDPRFLPDIDRATGFRTRTILCIPIFRKKRPVAVLELINKIDGPFDRQDFALLSRLVSQVSIALERADLHEQISSLGITDELTNMYNARYLDQTLEREVRRCKRYGSIMALIFLDLDNFKGINDTHGHPMGSRCLAEVSHIMVKSVRDVDILARYGGDEFVVILPETTVATAWMVAERLHESIGSHIFLADEGIKARLSASIGIAGFPDHAQTKEDLIRKADEAMYRAKSSGRNRICLADQP